MVINNFLAPPSLPAEIKTSIYSDTSRAHVSPSFILFCFCSIKSELVLSLSKLTLSNSTMAGLDRTLRVLDALGLFLVTRFPFIELFMLLMSTGEKAENLPGGQTFTFRDTLRREYVLVYVNAAVFFVCGTGMTLDFKRRKCGFVAALHAVVYTTITLFERKRYSEYLIVSIFKISPIL